eukprot:6211029-Pleurochrysis_carterae.AAC.2
MLTSSSTDSFVVKCGQCLYKSHFATPLQLVRLHKLGYFNFGQELTQTASESQTNLGSNRRFSRARMQASRPVAHARSVQGI